MTIREYAKKNDHEIVGKLVRRTEFETEQHKCRAYMDDAGNEYYVQKNGICIVTADGGVI